MKKATSFCVIFIFLAAVCRGEDFDFGQVEMDKIIVEAVPDLTIYKKDTTKWPSTAKFSDKDFNYARYWVYSVDSKLNAKDIATELRSHIIKTQDFPRLLSSSEEDSKDLDNGYVTLQALAKDTESSQMFLWVCIIVHEYTDGSIGSFRPRNIKKNCFGVRIQYFQKIISNKAVIPL